MYFFAYRAKTLCSKAKALCRSFMVIKKDCDFFFIFLWHIEKPTDSTTKYKIQTLIKWRFIILQYFYSWQDVLFYYTFSSKTMIINRKYFFFFFISFFTKGETFQESFWDQNISKCFHTSLIIAEYYPLWSMLF